MGRIVIVIIAVLASLMLADSLTCNQCSYGVLGFCLSNTELVCSTNTSSCFTRKTTFTGLTNVGFNSQGCQEPAGCNATTNGTVVGITYQSAITCCSTDKCNPVTVSAAPSTKMTFTAVIGVAAMAAMWGSVM
uniref:UPAR/Ly6 domain-containing protein n=2 Tax=Gasterosteus aculeatus TaxID=69293 RepID=A0AAQ4NW25_GASAC